MNFKFWHPKKVVEIQWHYFTYCLWLLSHAITIWPPNPKIYTIRCLTESFLTLLLKYQHRSGKFSKPFILKIFIRTEIMTYLAFPSVTRESTIPKMTRSEQMEEQILTVDLYFSETALYIVIFLLPFKP